MSKVRPDEKAIRILHIGKYFAPHRGGMETFLRDLMAEQQRSGLCVSALVHATEAGFRSKSSLQLENDEQLRITRAARWFTLAFAPISPTFPLLLDRCIRINRPHLLHIHMPNLSAFWCLLLPRALRIPWVIHWHADVLASTRSPALRWLYWLYRPFEQALLRRAARILATSPPYLASSRPLAAHRDKCEVVSLGIADLPGNRPSREITTGPTQDGLEDHTEGSVTFDGAGIPGTASEWSHSGTESNIVMPPYPGRPLRVICIGRLTYYKGVRFLIHAVARLDRVLLTIVGSGDEREALAAAAGSLGCEGKIRFTGELSDAALQAELARCDCLCLPSLERTEAFGVALLEAMRAGKATVATRVPGSGMSWVIDDTVTGLLAAPEDAVSLACALKQLRDNAALLRDMGNAGRKSFEERFRINQTAAAIAAVYERQPISIR